MTGIAHPDFFACFPMRPVTHDRLDAVLAEDVPQVLTLLFLWGRDCPNCDIAKAAMLARPERFQWPELRWLHDNVYDDPEMAAMEAKSFRLSPAKSTVVSQIGQPLLVPGLRREMMFS